VTAGQRVAPPQNLDAEQSVLGAVLLSDTALPVLADDEQLQPEDFYRESHGRIYQAMLDLHARHEPVDELTLVERLKHTGELEQVGGRAAIDLLAGSVPAVGNVRQYARIVRDNALLRRLLRVTYRVQADVHTVPPRELLEQTHDAVKDLDTSVVTQQRVDNATDFLAWYEAEQQGIPLPFDELTEAVGGGLEPGEVTVLGGWSRMGKSLFLKDMLLRACRHGARCHEYANEMSGPKRTARLISSLTGINPTRFHKRQLNADEWQRVYKVLNEGLPYETTPTDGWTVEDYCRAIRREKWDLAAIDTVNNLPCSKTDEWDRAVVMLADAAAHAGTHLIEVSQLNQARDTGAIQPTPTGRDLRNTGTWFQRARVVMFLHRDQELVEGTDIRRELSDGHVRIDKASHGDLTGGGFQAVTFNPKWMRFDRLDDYQAPAAA
jgi:replicative DNA helicase